MYEVKCPSEPCILTAAGGEEVDFKVFVERWVIGTVPLWTTSEEWVDAAIELREAFRTKSSSVLLSDDLQTKVKTALAALGEKINPNLKMDMLTFFKAMYAAKKVAKEEGKKK